ncbi:MAG: L,D-transpeptidase family protein [Pedobacter sp.]|nr:L,D-transpeptidase family protein [Pedobacter sp.]
MALKLLFSCKIHLLKKILLISTVVLLLLSSCKWFRQTPEIGLLLEKRFKNKLYKDFDTAAYNQVFIEHFDSVSKELSNVKILKAFYQVESQRPVWIQKFYFNGELDSLNNYISRSRVHGYNPKIFNSEKLDLLLKTLGANQFKDISEVYPIIADLELTATGSAIKYYNFVNFGSLNPRKLFTRYYIPVKRPDSTSIMVVLNTKNLTNLLKEIQPTTRSYILLQKALASFKLLSSKDPRAIMTVLVNMERQRWKLPKLGDEYVEVNIPDFSLTWFNKNDTLSHMNVCVGGKREDDYAAKIQQFLKTKNLDDKPKNHETPILYSKFNAIQVNPIWNIPLSIARSEIYYMARKDPYYLSNNNIKVYYKGREILDPDTIQWDKYSRERLPFQFKQGSGDGNALGKFKFIFDNNSSIYLHDTNNKIAFKYSNRAISHGCVRVERPLEFAENLIKDKVEYDILRMEVNLPPVDTTKMQRYKRKLAKKADTVNTFELKPKWFGVKKQIPILINYLTAWAQNGVLQIRPDVYQLDETLYDAMRKFM